MKSDRRERPRQETTPFDQRRAETLDAVGAFERVFEISSEAMKLIDLDGRVLRWNSACRDLYGWEESEVQGEVLPYVPTDMRFKVVQDIRSIAAGGRVVNRDNTALTKRGALLAVSTTVIPYLDSESNPVGVLTIAYPARGRDADAMPRDFSGAFARAARTPLAALVGYAQLLVHSDVAQDPTRRKRALRAIEDNLEVLVGLLDDVDLASESQGPSVPTDLENVSLVRAVTDAVHRVEPTRPDRGFLLDFEPDVGFVRTGRRRLVRALTNLITLAADNAREGGRVLVTVAGTADEVAVSIEASPNSSDPNGVAAQGHGDFGTLAWHGANLVAASVGGTLTRTPGEAGSVTYRMIVPASAKDG